MLNETLRARDAKLAIVSRELKAKFVGIDEVIDQFMNSVRIWYLMPELMTRPMIVNLWGLTGSGKTDLVRTFVRLLEMSGSFVELQLDIASDHTKIQSLIEYADIQTDKPSILLLDEIQRFKTKDEKGADMKSTALQDIWMLLSDGKFQSASDKKRDILGLIMDDLYYSHNEELFDKTQEDGKNKDTPEKVRKFKYTNPFWQARRLKKLLNCEDSIEDIMQWDQDTKLKRAQEALNSVETFEGMSYPKMLVIIAGNLDEAYIMADDVSNADVDADVFHEFSKRINVITIKAALSFRFKPEQVARFGNNHIIYTSLSRASYLRVIQRLVNQIIERVRVLHNVNIIPDESIYTTIYQNGVFPSQGVRPVMSTVSNIFESQIPTLLFKAIENDVDTITVSYVGNELVGMVGGIRVACKVELALDKIKADQNINAKALVSVHEAGHVLVYALLFRVAPTQIKSQTTSLENEGFIGQHKSQGNKNNTKDLITVSMASIAAEEIVFGDGFKSTGSHNDLIRATKLAASFVRVYAFDGFQTVISHPTDNGNLLNTDYVPTNAIIENIVKEEKVRATDLINRHKSLFKALVQELISAGEIQPEKVVELFSQHGEKISVVLSSRFLVDDYQEMWAKYKAE